MDKFFNDSIFLDRNILLRAIYPPSKKPDFWVNGRLSSAAFKDKRGLSVTCTNGKNKEESIVFMKDNFQGRIFSVTLFDCKKVNAYLVFEPSYNNPYHSEIHSSKRVVELNDEQALLLARSAKLENFGTK